MIKKIILILLTIIVLVVGGLAAYISFIDWNPYKGKLADELSSLTGLRVNINGSVSGSLFPQPHIAITDITLTDAQSGDQLAEATQIDTDVSLPSLLSGAPDITSLNVKGAEIWIKSGKNSHTNWHQETRPKFLSGAFKTKLQQLNLENAEVHYINEKYGFELDLNSVNLQLSAPELSGPYSIYGNLKKADDRFALNAMVGSVTRSEEIDLNFSVVHERSESELRFDGTYNIGNDNINGDFGGDSAKFADLANMLLGKDILSADYNKKMMFSVSMEVNDEAINFSRLVVKYEPFMEGAGDIYVTRMGDTPDIAGADIKYQFVNLDSRPIIEVFRSYFSEYQNGAKYEPDFAGEVKFDITAEHLIVSENSSGYLESAGLKGDWKDNALTIEEFNATGPGNTVLAVDGSMVESESLPKYFVRVALEGKNLLLFINSLDIALSAPQQNAYRDAKVQFEISGTPQNLSVNDIKIEMDKTIAGGTILADLLSDKYTLTAELNNINLDNYIAKAEVKDNSADWGKYFLTQMAPLQETSIEADMKIGEVIYRGFPLQNVALKLQSSPQNIALNPLKIDNFMHSAIEINAQLKYEDKENPQIEEMKYNITAQNLNELATRLKFKLPDCPLLNKAAAISGKLSGDMQKINTETDLRLSDAKMQYSGTLEAQRDKYVYDGVLSIDASNTLKFMRDMNLTPPDKNDLRVPLNAKAHISGSADNLNFADIAARLGTAGYSGSANLKKADTYKLTADIMADEFVLENVIYWQNSKSPLKKDNLFTESFLAKPDMGRDVFDFSPYKNIDLDVKLQAEKVSYRKKSGQNLRATILNAQNIMKLQDVSVTIGKSEYQGNLQINYEQNPQLSGHIDAQDVDIDDWRGKDYGIAINALNFSMDMAAPLSSLEDWFNNLSGNIIFNSGEVVIDGIDLSAIEQDLQQRRYAQGLFQVIRDNLQRGVTRFEHVGGNIVMNNGVLEFKDTLFNNEYTDMFMDGKVSLNEWKMNTGFKVRYKTLKNLPDYIFMLSGMMNKPSLDINIEALVQDYETRRAEIEQAEELKKAEEHQRLLEKIDVLQSEIEELDDNKQKLLADLEHYDSLTDIAQNKAEYQTMHQQLQDMDEEITQIKSKIRLADVTEHDVIQQQKKNKEFTDTISAIEDRLPALYAEDMQQRRQNMADDISEAKQRGAELIDAYKNMSSEAFQQLQDMDSEAYMTDNPNMKRWQKEVDEGNELLQKMAAEFASKTRKIQHDDEVTEDYLSEVADINSLMHKVLLKMQDVYTQSDNMLKSLIDERRKVRALEAEKNKDNLLFTENRDKKSTEVKSPRVNASETIKSMNFKPQETAADKPKSTAAADNGAVTEKDNAAAQTPAADIPVTEPQAAEAETGAVSAHTLLKRLEDGEVYDGTVSGHLRRSYDKDDDKSAPQEPSGLLVPLVGEASKTSGTITVK